MKARWRGQRRPRRVGLFGLLGDGSIGNDASMEALVDHIRGADPDVVLDAMCTGPDRLASVYGIEAIPLCWHQQRGRPQHGGRALVLKVVGKGLDAFRVPLWVRRHDVVMVPGMGVLEATLPLRPWETPYMLLLLCASGRLLGTRVALVSVGANVMRQRVTRRLFLTAARLASYRSYRDEISRRAMQDGGLDTTGDPVYPDLVFGWGSPSFPPSEPDVVGVGIMAFYGSNDHRARAERVHRTYVATMLRFVAWLLDGGHDVRLLVGDKTDQQVVDEILAGLEVSGTARDRRVKAEPIANFAELSAAMAPARVVVATRFHNVLCAVKLGKPTISLGYAAKNVALMQAAGLGDYCQSADAIDFDLLVKQFEDLERRSDELGPAIAERSRAAAAAVQEQFDELDALLTGGHRTPVRAPVVPAQPVR
jgi:polysaccharide pyruvyl transferase WcaK-like protein